ncbi:alcohol dehydrogenase IV [Thelephora terrestris]|uniref:Alcohol dehydrogenase IV n=1 Tax=Thelephora terrestris TaxID=56493 RepID=A0A9P6LCN4_9AGAM|nr:alcohol dehydrogenase IV [Thelephora terrestris]
MSASAISGFYAYTQTLKGVYYGPGSVKDSLISILEGFGTKKVLIVTGRSLRERTDVISRIEALLKEREIYGATFSEIGQHSPIADIRKAIQVLKDVNADTIVSVGGGSPIDASKLILHFLKEERGGSVLPHVAVPTTLSAAEYTPGAGYKDENGDKTALGGPDFPPAAVILDAELTLPTPEKLWLSTGIRALDHAVESLYRPLVAYPMKVINYEAISLLFKYLPISKDNPGNIAVRQKLQVAAWMSLWPATLSKPVTFGLSHDLSKRVGASYNVPHGISSCITLPPVVAIQTEFAASDDKEALARGLTASGKPSTGSIDGDIIAFSSEITNLIDSLGLTTRLSDYNIPREDIPRIVEKAIGKSSGELYDRVMQIMEKAF